MARKGKRGRPRVDAVVIRLVLSLHPGEDDDLIELYGRIAARRRSSVTKAVMRAGGIKAVDLAAVDDEAELAEAAGEFLA